VLRLPDQRGGEAGKEPLIKIEGKGGVLAAALSVPDWRKDAALAELLRAPLTRLAARYLAREKGKGGRALDPVAHFHLSNGARVERLNWLADVSPKGLAQSAGLMVNYAYRLSEIEANHEAYSGKYRVALSKEVKNWAEE